MGAHTDPVWMADFPGDGATVIRGLDSKPICSVPHFRPHMETAANVALIELAPELFRSVCELVAVMRASDVKAATTCTTDDWDAALDDAQSLIDLLADDLVFIDPSVRDGIVVLPMPMMTPPATVLMFRAVDGDVTILVHADDDRKTTLGQWNISSSMFTFVHTFLQEDGPLCGVLRHEKKIVGEVAILPGRQFKLTLGEHVQSVELAADDITDIINLFQGS